MISVSSAQITCPTGQVNCNGKCVNVTVSQVGATCGACGVVCPTGSTCVNGVCTSPCPQGQVNCNGNCVNVTVSQVGATCGTCGVVCPTGSTCVNGTCTSKLNQSVQLVDVRKNDVIHWKTFNRTIPDWSGKL